MVDAVSGTSLTALKARMFAGREAPPHARPATPESQASTAPPSSAAVSYKPGSVESENVQMATGMARAARTNIETLNIGVGSYNGATRLLANKDLIEDLRRRGGDKAVEMFTRGHKQIQRTALLMIKGAAGKMAQEFSITGTALSRSAEGSYKVGEYVQSTGEMGWSVSVKSNGQATAIANGVDVSAQVDDSSSSGFKWSAPGQSIDVAA